MGVVPSSQGPNQAKTSRPRATMALWMLMEGLDLRISHRSFEVGAEGVGITGSGDFIDVHSAIT